MYRYHGRNLNSNDRGHTLGPLTRLLLAVQSNPHTHCADADAVLALGETVPGLAGEDYPILAEVNLATF